MIAAAHGRRKPIASATRLTGLPCRARWPVSRSAASAPAISGGIGGGVTDAIMEFQQAATSRGLLVERIEADGRLHRCGVEGDKRGRESGSYILHTDGIPAGGFQNFKDGIGWENWRAQPELAISAEDRRIARERIAVMQRQRIADEMDRHQAAVRRAADLWGRGKPATNAHPYLLAKGVPSFGLRQLREALMLPLRDAAGVLWTLQFIGEDGTKRFLTGGRKAGCYLPIGRPGRVLCVCEGYATAASVFVSTGHATAAAFDCGNLLAVGRALRAKFPDLALVFVADNDTETPGNPGVTHAIAAARAVRGEVAIPEFEGAA